MPARSPPQPPVEREFGSSGDVLVGEARSATVITIGPDADVDEAVTVMRENAVRRIPVVQ